MERNRSDTTSRLPAVAFLLAIVAIYLARQILVPLSVAVLLSFLLTPTVRRLERWKLGRLGSVLLVFVVSMAWVAGWRRICGGQTVNRRAEPTAGL